MLLRILTLIGALGMFLYGMNMMSSGLQRAAGKGLRNLIGRMTSNPFKRVITGFGVTAAIQSSSATTVMVVGFVNAGLLTLTQAIGVIMGANIGTTMTAWIIAIFGFKADVSILAVPLMALGFLLSASKKNKHKNIADLVIGFSLLFLGLSFMKNSVPDLQSTPQVLEFITNWSGHGFLSVLLFLGLGTILTLIVQSSSATVAITLIMLNMGWIGFDMAAAMILGENIGTTITANIAAAIGTSNARRAAIAHTVFNLFGVIWALALFNPFISFIQWIVNSVGLGGMTETPLYSISMLHTVFNIFNTGLLIWFTPQIEKLVCLVIKDNKELDADKSVKLKYITAGPVPTTEFAIEEAAKEMAHFGHIMQNGLSYVKEAIANANNPEKFAYYREKLIKYENISDDIEYQIVEFMNALDSNELSDSSILKKRALYRISGELESLGDSGEAISRVLSRKNEHEQVFSKEHEESLYGMIDLLNKAFNAMIANLEKTDVVENIEDAEQAELQINKFRDELRNKEYANVESKGDTYFESVFFLTLLGELERMGDYIINVSQTLKEIKK